MSLTRRQLLATTAAAPLAAFQRPVSKPSNLLLILSDDLGSWMTGAYGNKEIRTPNINELARGGVRLVNHFAASPMCSSSRATLFTGRTPRQHGILDFLTDNPSTNPPQGQAAPPPSFASEIFLSEMLGAKGYRNGFVGRWQMGADEKPQHGFEFWYVLLNTSYDKPRFSFGGKLFDEEGYQSELITGRALQFLDEQKQDQPFFLVASYLNPHLPYTGHPQKYLDLYKDTRFDTIGWEPLAPNASRQKEMMADPVGNIRKVAASIAALDDQIPPLIQKLRDRGFWENTLVVFTSESGFLLGRHGMWNKGHGSVPPNMYEESVQVPMIWNWPGRLPVQTYRVDLTSNYDFVPSVCEALEVTPPANRNLTGRSYLPILQAKPLPKDRPWLRMVFAQLRDTEMARDNRFKLVIRDAGRGPNELYDLISDPREKTNQFASDAFVTVKERLMRALDDWRKRQG
jgi:arylsulfatase A-like enzyme